MSKKWMTSVRAKNVEFRILKSGEAGWKFERAWKQAHISFSTNSLAKGEHVMTVEFTYGKRIDIPIGEEMDKFQVQHSVGRVTITSHKKRSTFNIKSVSRDDAHKMDVFLQKVLDEKTSKTNVTTPTKLAKASPSKNFLAGKLKAHNLDKVRSLIDKSSTTATKVKIPPSAANIAEKENTTPPAGSNAPKRTSDVRLVMTTNTPKASVILTPTKDPPWKTATDGKRKSLSPNYNLHKRNRHSTSPLKNTTQIDARSDVILPTLESPLGRRNLLGSKLQSPKSAKKDISTSGVDCQITQVTPGKKETKKSQRKFDDFRRAQAEVRQAKIHTDLTDEKENTSPPSGSSDRKTTGLTKRSFYGANTSAPSFASELNKVRIVHTTPSPNRKLSTPSKFQLAMGSGVRRSLLQDVGQKKSDSPKKKPEKTSNDFGPFQFGSVDGTSSLFGDNNNNDNNKENLLFQPLADTANLFTSGEGFQNLGNTCYMNSTLQSLFGLLPFQYDLYSVGKKLDRVLQTDSLLLSMVRLMKQRTSTNSEKRVLLRKVKHAISISAKQFHGFLQHDAHEFLRLCLDLLQEDVTKANKLNVAEANNNNNIDVTPTKQSSENNLDCPVAKNFSFSVVQQIVCNKCKSVAKAKDEWYDLPVELQQKTNESGDTLHLQHLINSSFAEENIEHVCEDCKFNQATVTRNIVKLPRIMMIYLKRYSYNQTSDHSEKLRLPVALPLYVSFNHFCAKDVEIDTTLPDVDKGVFHNDHEKPQSGSTQMEVVIVASDDEPDTKLPAVATFLNNTPLSKECNNNNGNTNTPLEKTETINLLSSEDDKELTKALEMSEMEFFDNQQKQYNGILHHDKLRNLSEDEQVLLAMQLSLQNDKDSSLNNNNEVPTFLNNNTTSIDTNENIMSLPGTSEQTTKNNACLSNTPVKCTSFFTKANQTEKQTAQTVPSISPEKKSSDPQKSHGSGSVESTSMSSFSTIGSTKLDAFLSDESDHDDDVTHPVFNQNKSSDSNQQLVPSLERTAPSEKLDTNGTTEKLSQKVDDVCDQEIEAEANSYRLVSVVSHKGGSSNVGHYVSDVLSDISAHKWQCFDDSHVENVSESKVLLGRQSTSYLLFYLHKDLLSLYKP
uniref:Ubiquitin carboxyl-terminal hydrolase 37 n=1 Tax=Phallusia mammillata TaxID=59560 RepID=A0A6F9DVS2_9ASCI|nr:ubiquitin carboxyl-terminal hydrolase 37 [Phallusia mammillata]